jgi:hypothetical protein
MVLLSYPKPKMAALGMALHEIIYHSRNRREPSERSQLTKLREIVSQSMASNAKNGLTGFLVMRDDWFLQILEGEEPRVEAVYARIATDTRHERCTILRRRKIMTRSFQGWSMGGVLFTPEQQGIYLQHGISSTFDPTLLNPQKAHDLAFDLMRHEADQRRKAS